MYMCIINLQLNKVFLRFFKYLSLFNYFLGEVHTYEVEEVRLVRRTIIVCKMGLYVFNTGFRKMEVTNLTNAIVAIKLNVIIRN